MDSFLGRTVHGYTILEKLGAGSFGIVYKAQEVVVDRPVAIKVILPEYAQTEEFIKNFEDEARVVAALEHPNIVPLYTYWQDEEGAFIVMRYIKSGSLRELMKKEGALSLLRTVRLVSQIADALHMAHEAGIVHCDLKPENILLDERGSAYLTDFGLAQRINAAKTDDGIKGTPAYLSPEQISTFKITARSDIYALGIMVYELLAGKHPFRDNDTQLWDLIKKHESEPLPSIFATRTDLPETVDEILQKAAAKDPDDRYQTLPDLMFALQNLTNEAVSGGHKYPSTRDTRNRTAMLHNIEKIWIEGVLKSSLQGTQFLELGLKPAETSVNTPWASLLRPLGKGGETLAVGTHIREVFDKLNGKLLILGDPGSGKTTTLLELARELLSCAEYDIAHPIPVILNLSSWGEAGKPIAEWLVDELGNKYQVPEKVAREWVETNALTLLLDGLDEVTTEQRDQCVKAINTYREDHGFVDIVVCSRVQDYESLTRRLSLNGAVLIQPLDDLKVDQYLASLGESMSPVRERLRDDARLRELSRSPLMLNVISLAGQNADFTTLPADLSYKMWCNHLFEVYVNQMISRRSKNLGYAVDEILRYLNALARQMNDKSQTVFLIENLQPDWLPAPYRARFRLMFASVMIVLHALVWGIPRYLTADFAQDGAPAIVRGLAWAFAGGVWGAVVGFGLFQKRRYAAVVGLVFGFAVSIESFTTGDPSAFLMRLIPAFMIYTIVFSVIEYILRRRIKNVDVIESVDLLQFQRSAVHPMVYVSGFIGGMVTSVLNSIVYASPTLTPTHQIIGLMGAPIASLVAVYIASFTGAEVSFATRPNEGIRRTLVNSVKMSLIVTVGLSISLFVTTFPVTSMTFYLVQVAITAVPFGFIGGIVYGGYYVVQHLVLRSVLSSAGILPPNIAQFLNTAASLGFVRRAGGSYLFVHGMLRDYFAERATF